MLWDEAGRSHKTRLAIERSGGDVSAARGRGFGRFLDGQSRRKRPDGPRQVHRILGIRRGGLQRIPEVTSFTPFKGSKVPRFHGSRFQIQAQIAQEFPLCELLNPGTWNGWNLGTLEPWNFGT